MADIADILHTPESTIRSHCKRFDMFMSYIGEDRERRYKSESLDVLRTVAECYARKMPTNQIIEHLSRLYPQTVAAEQQQASSEQQQAIVEQQQAALPQQLALAMMMLFVAGQKEIMQELTKTNDRLDQMEQQQTATMVIDGERHKQVDTAITEWRIEKERRREWEEEIEKRLKENRTFWARIMWWR